MWVIEDKLSLPYEEKYSPPERLIPQGWLPPDWVPTDPKVNIPPGVQYFTPEDALMVANLCPDSFPAQQPLSPGTAFFALTRLASTNRMVVTRLRTPERRIIAVALLAKHDALVSADHIRTIEGRHTSLVIQSAILKIEAHHVEQRMRREMMRLLLRSDD
jgi:hypothetical protein